MTALDRAFIKAYGDEVSGAAMSRGEPFGQSHQSARLPQLDSSALPAALNLLDAKVDSASAPAPKATSAKAPLSSFATSSFATAAPVRDAVRPVFEIDQLAWPEVCDGLLDRAAEQWGAFSAKVAQNATQGQKAVAIAGGRPGEGRTTIALSLAKSLAARGLNCLVVDANFAKPDLALACNISPLCSWGDVMDGKLPLGEALISASRDRVTLMPWRGPAPSMAQITNLRLLSSNFVLLRQHFDITILDCMPLEETSTITELSDLALAIDLDHVYVVWDVMRTARVEVARLSASMRSGCLNVAGLIENFVDPIGTRASATNTTALSAAPPALAAAT